MKTLACRDMGVECDHVAQGETMEEVMKAGMDHAMAEHGEVMQKMMAEMSTEDMNAKAMSMVKDA